MADSRAERVLGQLHHLLNSATTPAEDGRLLERFVMQRDEDAFAELVARHGPLVFGLCRRLLGNVQDAEDVFQATFLVLARKAAAIRKPASLSCFLHSIAYRLAIKTRTEIQRRRLHEQHAHLPCEIMDTDVSWREVRGLIDEELQRLPEKQRLPLLLCYLEGLTQDEAARRLGWPRGTLKRRLEVGRERLRIRLTHRGVTLGASLFAVALTESATRGAVSATLRDATVRAGVQFLTNGTAALTAMPAVLLAKGALQTMLTSKLKLGAMLILLLGCMTTAAGLAIMQEPAAKPAENKPEASAPPRAVEVKQVRKDRYGDPLPEGAIARLGTVRLRHPHMTSSAVFTSDGKTAIIGDGGGSIVYWDVATGREVRRLQSIPGVIHALAITRDGKTLASGSWGQVGLWEVASGKLISQSPLDNDAIMQMLFTPDGKTLALRDQGNTLHLWDVVGKKKLHDLKGHTGKVACMALSPDGKTLASGSWEDAHICLWDIATGKEKLQIVADKKGVLSLAYSPDGKTLAARGNWSKLAFFEADTGKRLPTDKDSYGGVLEIVYAPDGKTLIGIEGGGRAVHVLDANGKHLRKFDAPPGNMAGLTISPDGKAIATYWGGAHTFDLWDAARGKLLHPSQGHRFGVRSLAFLADSERLFSTEGPGPLDWDAATGRLRGRLGDLSGCNCLALSPNGKLLAAGGRGGLHLLDSASSKVVRSCIDHTGEVTSVAWSADGKTLISGSSYNQTLHVWDPVTGKQRRTIEIKQRFFDAIALSPDGATAAVGDYFNGTIRLWLTASGKELPRIAMRPGLATTVVFSPDGTVLACGGKEISLWDAATRRLLRRWDAKDNEFIRLAFSSDGRTLVATGVAVRLWETATGKERASFTGPPGGIWSVAISRDGRRIASGNADTTILVWDATGGVRPDAALSAEQLRALWRDLRATDASRAYRAMWQIALAPKQALPFLAERLRPITPPDVAQQKQPDRFVADLDSEQFTVRQQAEAELEKMGPKIEPTLRKALEGKPSLEVRQRIEKVLEKLASERLRILRVLEALEHMNTPEACRLVESLANGVPHTWLREEARAVRKRLDEQTSKAP